MPPGEGVTHGAASGWMQLTRRDLQQPRAKWVQLGRPPRPTRRSACARTGSTARWRASTWRGLLARPGRDRRDRGGRRRGGRPAAHHRSRLCRAGGGAAAGGGTRWRPCVNAGGTAISPRRDRSRPGRSRRDDRALCLRQPGAPPGGLATSGPALRDTLRMAVAVGSASVMLPFECTLSGAGAHLRDGSGLVTDDMPEEDSRVRSTSRPPSAYGSQPGWRKLDVIALGRKSWRWTRRCLGSGSTHGHLSQPWAGRSPLGQRPQPLQATRCSSGPPKAADLRPNPLTGTFAAEHEAALERWHQAIAQRAAPSGGGGARGGSPSARTWAAAGRSATCAAEHARAALLRARDVAKRKGTLDLKTRTPSLPYPYPYPYPYPCPLPLPLPLPIYAYPYA